MVAEVEQIKQIASTLKAIIDFSDKLESIASIEQATNEAMSAMVKAQTNRDSALSELQKANILLADAKADYAKTTEEAQSKIDDTRALARDIIEKATNHAVEISNSANDQVDQAMKRLDSLHQACEQASQQLKAKQAEYDVLVAKIDEAKKAAIAESDWHVTSLSRGTR